TSASIGGPPSSETAARRRVAPPAHRSLPPGSQERNPRNTWVSAVCPQARRGGLLQGLHAAPPCAEELLDHRRAVLGEDAGGQPALVVEAGVLEDVVERGGGPGLLVGRPVDHP